MKRLTKKEMVKEIFYLATEGQRTAGNFVQGMGVIDAIAENNYYRTIREAYESMWDIYSPKGIIRELVRITRENLLGRNLDKTPRYLAFSADLKPFRF